MYCVTVTLLSSPRGKKLNKTVNPLIKIEGEKNIFKKCRNFPMDKTFEKRGKTAGVLKLSSSSKTFSTLVTPLPPNNNNNNNNNLLTETAL